MSLLNPHGILGIATDEIIRRNALPPVSRRNLYSSVAAMLPLKTRVAFNALWLAPTIVLLAAATAMSGVMPRMSTAFGILTIALVFPIWTWWVVRLFLTRYSGPIDDLLRQSGASG